MNAPGASNGDITARRLPNAWLAVQGGSAPIRQAVLRHLHTSIHLH